MEIMELEREIRELPELYGKISHEAEVKRSEWELADQSLSLKVAGETLRLSTTTLEDETASAKATRIKNKVIVDTHNETMEVLKKKSEWKKLELEADTLSKKIMLLCKGVDIYLGEQYQVGRIEKTGKPVFPTKSKMGEF